MEGRVPISDKTKPPNNRETGRFPRLENDSLKGLEVIQRLEVGPVRLDRRRITAPYRVIGNHTDDTIDLAYRFEEDVFVPDEPASINLGNMISAQVALNYGLFCEEIVFRGQFDTHDRRFIEGMAKNTAREIFVKKFLEPNPFLMGTVTELPPTKLRTYLRAKISFPDTDSGSESESLKKEGKTDSWNVENSRHAVLSSGGKDSLLSFGLLKEIGCEVHPIFINESGRHWFTALNAYRHFQQKCEQHSASMDKCRQGLQLDAETPAFCPQGF